MKKLTKLLEIKKNQEELFPKMLIKNNKNNRINERIQIL